MTIKPISVLVVDDSPVAAMVLSQILGSDAAIRVVGVVADGQTAVDFVRRGLTDLVLMDFHMPYMNGGAATRRIMQAHPVPVVICSGVSEPGDIQRSFGVLEAGALACVAKPDGSGTVDDCRKIAGLLQTVKLMAEVKVVRHWSPGSSQRTAEDCGSVPIEAGERPRYKIVGIGASTGGPMAIKAILEGLPDGFPIPILVVQHICAGFVQGLVGWLASTTPLKVAIATQGGRPLPGHVYLAPDGRHLEIGKGFCLQLSSTPPMQGPRPSVSRLFDSLAIECGREAIGVLLTGMGTDGAAELAYMKQRGAMTIVQDCESCVVAGMPGEAIALGAATLILPPEKISGILSALVRSVARKAGAA
ncbi:MAG: chemotaxis protein CheB [Verrucomicrobium sp.]|nr:chemotaxis protein CheB [Verrucomicrobium sp.]